MAKYEVFRADSLDVVEAKEPIKVFFGDSGNLIFLTKEDGHLLIAYAPGEWRFVRRLPDSEEDNEDPSCPS